MRARARGKHDDACVREVRAVRRRRGARACARESDAQGLSCGHCAARMATAMDARVRANANDVGDVNVGALMARGALTSAFACGTSRVDVEM